MLYRISFHAGDDGLVANDVFQALNSEYEMVPADNGWYLLTNYAYVKNEGAYLYIKCKDEHFVKGMTDWIVRSYKEYEPEATECAETNEKVESTYNPTSRREAFRAMRKGHLELHKLSEAFAVLKKAGATIIAEDTKIDEAHPVYDKQAQESHKELFIQKDAPKLDAALKIIQRLYPEATYSLSKMEIVKSPLGSYRSYPLENVDGRLLEIRCGLFENRGNLYNYKVIEWSQPSKKSYTEKGYGDNMLKKWVRDSLKYKTGA